jgi:hypothetical protein
VREPVLIGYGGSNTNRNVDNVSVNNKNTKCPQKDRPPPFEALIRTPKTLLSSPLTSSTASGLIATAIAIEDDGGNNRLTCITE